MIRVELQEEVEGNEELVNPLSSAVKLAIELSVENAMKLMEDKILKAETNWKAEASIMIENVAKNRYYIESFVARQGDYVTKLNNFAEEFRLEIDSKIHKGLTSGNGVVNDMLGGEDLPADYYWRLQRIEKQVGTHRYLEKNKEARSVNDRLTALENAAGIDPNANTFVDHSSWNNFPSRPTSSLRVFSRETTNHYGQYQKGERPSSIPQNVWDDNVSLKLYV